jgi:hypothetical protein
MGDQDTMMLALSVEPMGGGDWRWCWYDHNSGKALADGVERSERAAWTEATIHYVDNSDVVVRSIVARAEAAEQRAEALAAEVARLRADARALAGLFCMNETEARLETIVGITSADVVALMAADDDNSTMTDADLLALLRRALAEAQPAEVADG